MGPILHAAFGLCVLLLIAGLCNEALWNRAYRDRAYRRRDQDRAYGSSAALAGKTMVYGSGASGTGEPHARGSGIDESDALRGDRATATGREAPASNTDTRARDDIEARHALIRIPWRTVAGGVVLQLLLAVLLLDVPGTAGAMALLNDAAGALHDATLAGTKFVFGYLAGPPYPFTEGQPGGAYILAFEALPLVLTISALASLLFHWGVLQRITAGFAFLLRRPLGIGGPLALGAAVHVFVGMVEAPLLVRPYLTRMQRGELFALMSCGLAGVAGTVMVIYASFLAPVVPNALGNILIASVISTPAALAVSALMVPFAPPDPAEARLVTTDPPVNALDALVRGTLDGVPILVAIVAMLLVAVSLVTLVNMGLGHLPAVDGAPVTLQRIVALPFRPLLWAMGVPWPETAAAASLMASKTVLNEFVAYLNFSRLPPETFSPRTRMILTYALCGFANLGSLGIMVGGLGAMIPERRGEIVRLGMRSVVAGTLATCMSGTIAGALV